MPRTVTFRECREADPQPAHAGLVQPQQDACEATDQQLDHRGSQSAARGRAGNRREAVTGSPTPEAQLQCELSASLRQRWPPNPVHVQADRRRLEAADRMPSRDVTTTTSTALTLSHVT